MSGALARLLFYPTLGYNVLMEKISSRRWFDRVDQTVILGALPFKSMTDEWLEDYSRVERLCRKKAFLPAEDLNSGDWQELVHKENVRGVVTMNEEYETKYLCNSSEEWKAVGVEQLQLSTVDLTGVPRLVDLHKGVEFVLRHKEQGSSVYVHCKAGRSRSATLVAAYLIRLYCWSPEEACQALMSIRPHVLVRSTQMEVLHQYFKQVCCS